LTFSVQHGWRASRASQFAGGTFAEIRSCFGGDVNLRHVNLSLASVTPAKRIERRPRRSRWLTTLAEESLEHIASAMRHPHHPVHPRTCA
jgi:hypothetical protein